MGKINHTRRSEINLDNRNYSEQNPLIISLKTLQRLISIPFAGILIGISLFAFHYWQYGLTHFLGMVFTLSISIICILGSLLLIRKNKQNSGGLLLLFALLIPYWSAEYFAKNITVPIYIGGIILIILISNFVLLQNRILGWLFLVPFSLFIFYVNRIEPIQRYPAFQYPILYWFMIAAIAIIALAMLLQGWRVMQFSTIRTRLLTASALLVFTTTILISSVTFYLVRQISVESSEKELAVYAKVLLGQLENWFDNLETSLKADIQILNQDDLLTNILQVNQEILIGDENYQNLEKILFSESDLQDSFQNILILDKAGNVIVSKQPIIENASFIDIQHTQTKQPGFYLFVNQIDETNNQLNLIASFPIIGNSSQLIGSIIGLVSFTDVEALLAKNFNNPDDSVYIVNDGGLIYGAPINESFLRSFWSQEELLPNTEGVLSFTNPWGNRALGFYTWLPQLNSFLVVDRKVAAVYSSYNRYLLIMGLIAAGIISLTIGVAILLARSIAEPITELESVAQEITQGDYSSRAIVQTKDEIGRLATAFNLMTDQLEDMIAHLELLVEKHTEEINRKSWQITAAAQVGNTIVTIYSLDELLARVTKLISQKFGFYHVGVFLLDEFSEYAVLQAANSSGGQRMLARGHRLAVGKTGIVGYVTEHNTARIALDVGLDAVFFNNPDLPETRSEMALPLAVSGEVLGALDIQSKESNAFDQDDIEILQLLADQIAVAIKNAQLFARTEEALETARLAYREISQEAWTEYLQGKPNFGYQSISKYIQKPDSGWHGQSKEAMQKGEIVRSNGNAYTLSIPIKIRNTIIGVIDTYKTLDKGDWTEEEINTLEQITNQLGVALDSARLYDESRFQAESERLLAEFSSHFHETLDIDFVIKTAISDLLNSLNVSEVEIRLENEPGFSS